jgi:hypothetical protein
MFSDRSSSKHFKMDAIAVSNRLRSLHNSTILPAETNEAVHDQYVAPMIMNSTIKIRSIKPPISRHTENIIYQQ